VVDSSAERRYNRDKLANNVIVRCCKNTTKDYSKSC